MSNTDNLNQDNPRPMRVNPQISDSVTQAGTQVLGTSPAVSTGNLYMASSQALGNAAHNATTNGYNVNTTSQAALTQGVAKLMSIDTATTARGTQKIYEPKPQPVPYY